MLTIQFHLRFGDGGYKKLAREDPRHANPELGGTRSSSHTFPVFQSKMTARGGATVFNVLNFSPRWSVNHVFLSSEPVEELGGRS